MIPIERINLLTETEVDILVAIMSESGIVIDNRRNLCYLRRDNLIKKLMDIKPRFKDVSVIDLIGVKLFHTDKWDFGAKQMEFAL